MLTVSVSAFLVFLPACLDSDVTAIHASINFIGCDSNPLYGAVGFFLRPLQKRARRPGIFPIAGSHLMYSYPVANLFPPTLSQTAIFILPGKGLLHLGNKFQGVYDNFLFAAGHFFLVHKVGGLDLEIADHCAAGILHQLPVLFLIFLSDE
jgi:hypothetical protein